MNLFKLIFYVQEIGLTFTAKVAKVFCKGRKVYLNNFFVNFAFFLSDLCGKIKKFKINDSNPYSLSFNYYEGIISEEMKQKQKGFIQKVMKNNGNVEINDSEEQKAERQQARISQKLQHEEDKRKDEAKELAENIAKENQRKVEKERKSYADFKGSVSLKVTDVTEKSLFDGFTGECTCTEMKLTKAKQWNFDDTFKVYTDKNNQWYIYGGSWTKDKGPYADKDDLLKAIYEENYKEK